MIPPCAMMYLQNEKGRLKAGVRFFIYFLAASFAAVGMNFNFSDDGLRHLAFANSKSVMGTWGEVFPHSLFGNYDPWSFWDGFLSFVIRISSFETAHIIVNIISLFTLLILLDKIYNIELKRFKNTIPLLLMIFLLHGFYRYTNLRPDLISGFYIMGIYILSKNSTISSLKKTIFISLLTLLYTPTYYLFFVYTVASFAYLFLIRDIKNSLILLCLTALGFAYYFFMFGTESLETVVNILNDANLRDGLSVGEGASYFRLFDLIGIKYWILIYGIVLLIAKIKFSNFLEKNKLFALLLTLSLLWIGQMRYFQLFEPLLEVFFVSLILNIDAKNIRLVLKTIKKAIVTMHKEIYKTDRNLSFVVIFSFFLAFESGIISHGNFSKENTDKTKMEKEFKKPIYNNKIILFSTLDASGYYALYANPTIKEIPSCSIGWEKGSNRFHRLYKKMITKEATQEELLELGRLAGADFIFIEIPASNTGTYSFGEFKESDYVPIEVFDKFLVLKKKEVRAPSGN